MNNKVLYEIKERALKGETDAQYMYFLYLLEDCDNYRNMKIAFKMRDEAARNGHAAAIETLEFEKKMEVILQNDFNNNLVEALKSYEGQLGSFDAPYEVIGYLYEKLKSYKESIYYYRMSSSPIAKERLWKLIERGFAA